MAENARVRAMVQRMIDEGAEEATIREFVQKARASLARPVGPRTPGTSARDIATQQLGESSQSTPKPGAMVDNGPAILSDQPYAEYDERGMAVVPPESLAYERQGPLSRAAQSVRGQDPAARRKLADLRSDPGIAGLEQIAAATRGFGAGGGAGMLAGAGLGALGTLGEAALPAEVVAGVAPAARVAAPAIEGAAGGAVGNAVAAGELGGDVRAAAEEGGITGGALGPLGAAVAELLASGSRGVSNLLRRNKQIGTRARAQEAGAYEDPAMKALTEPEPGETGVPSPELQMRRAADVGTKRVVDRMQGIKRQAGEDYQSATNPIGPRTPTEPLTDLADSDPDLTWRHGPAASDPLLDAARRVDAPGLGSRRGGYTPDMPVEGQSFPQEGLAAHFDRPALEEALNAAKARNTNTRTGRPYNKAIDDRLTTLIDDLGPTHKTVSTDVTFQRPSPMTTDEALHMRRSLKEEAGFGTGGPQTPEQLAARKAYGALRAGIHKASPDIIKPADDAYAAMARKMNRAEQIVGVEDDVIQQSRPLLAEDAPYELADDFAPDKAWEMPVAAEKRATTNLARVGDNNVPGVNMNKYLAELADMDPEFRKALQFIADKKALEATKFGIGGHLPESLPSLKEKIGPALRQNARALGFTAEQLASGAAQGTKESLRAIAPQLALNPLLQAYAAEQERKRRADPRRFEGKHAITHPRAPD